IPPQGGQRDQRRNTLPRSGASLCPCPPQFDSDPRHRLAVVVENIEHATVNLDFDLWKQPAHVNNGFQTVPQRAAWEIPHEVDRCLHSDLKPNLPVLRLPLQLCASVSSARRQPATCGGDSAIEGVQQNQPVADDRSSSDRHEGLQALRNTIRQCCLVDRVLGLGDQLWAPSRRGPVIALGKWVFPDWKRRSTRRRNGCTSVPTSAAALSIAIQRRLRTPASSQWSSTIVTRIK